MSLADTALAAFAALLPEAGPIGLLMGFAFYYPATMSVVWMTGGLYYFLRRERGQPPRHQPPPLAEYPFVTLMVPCYNEGANCEDTISALDAQAWPDFEIIAINDGSRDDTAVHLERLAKRYPRLRVIHLDRNLGKANALKMGTIAAKGEYLVCVDGDAMLDRYATHWMMLHLTSGPRVGAVTGNPRIRNRSTLLGRLQVGEFSSIIGMIKRAQRVYGRIFTLSGVIAGFRKSALHRIGYWSEDMITEDIDISWRLQLDHWDIRYEPNALCYILMPETLRGLWKQRLRWAQGGVEVMQQHAGELLNWRKRRMWGVIAEYFTSVLWAYVMLAIIVLWLLGLVFPMPDGLYIDSIMPRWHGVVLGLLCLTQFAVSMVIDRRYEKGIGRHYFWMIWYPLAYWMLSLFTTVVALPKTVFRKGRKRATWTSPDRGIGTGSP